MATVISGPAQDVTAWLHTQTVPSALVQIVHSLGYAPAGVLCVEDSGDITEPGSITYPMDGVVEVAFGFLFTGQIRLS